MIMISLSTACFSYAVFRGLTPESAVVRLAQKIVDVVASIFAWITSIFIKEPIVLSPQPPQPVEPPIPLHPEPAPPIEEGIPDVPLQDVPAQAPVEEEQPLFGPAEERALVLYSSTDLREPQPLAQQALAVRPPSQVQIVNGNGRLNLQEMARNVQWIRPEGIPPQLRMHVQPGVENIGILHLPRDVYEACFAQMNRALVRIDYPEDQEAPLPFLLDGSVPLLDESVNNAPVLTASWVQVSPAEAAELIAERKAALGIEGPENLLSYLGETVSKGAVRDKDPIRFSEGKIEAGSSQNSREVLLFLIERTYGSSIAERISVTESLRAPDAPPLTWVKLKEVMVAVAAQVRSTDFELLFKKIKGERVEGFLCADYLNPQQRALISGVRRFQDLKPEHIAILEQAFRTVPAGGESKPTLDAFFPKSKKYPQGFWSSSRFILNARILQTLGYIQALDPDDISLATAEYLGKTTCYLQLEEGMVIPLPSCTGEKIYFKVERVFMREGVVFQIFAPLTEGQHPEDELKTLYLNFRGTQARVSVDHGPSSLLRDVDYRGIGANFRDEDVIDELRPYLQEGQVLKINGHSLGGVDAQRAVACILEAIQKDQLPCVKKIEVHCFNSPAPEAGVNERCQKALRFLEAGSKPVSVDVTYVRFESDPIQGLGDVFVGASNQSNLMGVRVVTFSSEQIRSLKAHGAIACNNILKSAEFQKTVIDRFTPGRLLEKVLSHNYFWDAENSSFVSRAGDAVYWYGSAVGHAVMKPLHFMLHQGGTLLCVLASSLTPDGAAAQRQREYRELVLRH